MTPTELKAWRSRLGWDPKQAARKLSLSQNGYAAYERGYIDQMRDIKGWGVGKRIPRPIPTHVALACERLEQMK